MSVDYSSLLELLQARRSVRKFVARSVPREELLRLLEAARWAPSNHNRQPWRFLVYEEKAQIEALAESVRQHLAEKLKSLPSVAEAYAGELLSYATFFAHAPALLVVLHRQPISASAPLLAGTSEPSLVSGEPLSVAMAVQNVLLAAHVLGLGACVLTGPLLVEEVLYSAIHVPAGHRLNCLLAVGYPAESPSAPRRKSLEQILEFRSPSGSCG